MTFSGLSNPLRCSGSSSNASFWCIILFITGVQQRPAIGWSELSEVNLHCLLLVWETHHVLMEIICLISDSLPHLEEQMNVLTYF